MLVSKHLLSAIYALGSSDYPRSCDKYQGIHSTVHSSTGCERISDLSVNITHVIPTLDLRRCSPAASAIGGLVLARRLPATGAAGSARRPRRAAGAAGGQPVGGKPAGDQPRARRRRCRRPARCRRGRFPLLPDKGGHEARWEVPKERCTNEPSCWPAFTV